MRKLFTPDTSVEISAWMNAQDTISIFSNFYRSRSCVEHKTSATPYTVKYTELIGDLDRVVYTFDTVPEGLFIIVRLADFSRNTLVWEEVDWENEEDIF